MISNFLLPSRHCIENMKEIATEKTISYLEELNIT